MSARSLFVVLIRFLGLYVLLVVAVPALASLGSVWWAWELGEAGDPEGVGRGQLSLYPALAAAGAALLLGVLLVWKAPWLADRLHRRADAAPPREVESRDLLALAWLIAGLYALVLAIGPAAAVLTELIGGRPADPGLHGRESERSLGDVLLSQDSIHLVLCGVFAAFALTRPYGVRRLYASAFGGADATEESARPFE